MEKEKLIITPACKKRFGQVVTIIRKGNGEDFEKVNYDLYD